MYEFLSDEDAARRKSIFTTGMLTAKVPFEEIDSTQ